MRHRWERMEPRSVAGIYIRQGWMKCKQCGTVAKSSDVKRGIGPCMAGAMVTTPFFVIPCRRGGKGKG